MRPFPPFPATQRCVCKTTSAIGGLSNEDIVRKFQEFHALIVNSCVTCVCKDTVKAVKSSHVGGVDFKRFDWMPLVRVTYFFDQIYTSWYWANWQSTVDKGLCKFVAETSCISWYWFCYVSAHDQFAQYRERSNEPLLHYISVLPNPNCILCPLLNCIHHYFILTISKSNAPFYKECPFPHTTE